MQAWEEGFVPTQAQKTKLRVGIEENPTGDLENIG